MFANFAHMSRRCDDIYHGTMPLRIVNLSILAGTPRRRDGAPNIFRLSLKTSNRPWMWMDIIAGNPAIAMGRRIFSDLN